MSSSRPAFRAPGTDQPAPKPAAYMVVAFRRGQLTSEVGGDGHGFTIAQATAVAHDLHAEFPDAVVALLPARKSWEGGWPWTTPDGSEHR